MASPLIRTALMVRDLASSRSFYEAVLALRGVYLDADLTDTSAWKLLGVKPGSGVRALILKPSTIAGRRAPDFGMIGLFELAGAAARGTRQDDRVSLGEPVLVFYVADLAAALGAVRANGGSIVSGPEQFTLPGVSVSEAIVRDPDGVAINLVEAPEGLAWETTDRR